MAQQRDAPAYQEYAASMMARREYRTMSLAERGLLYTLRLECWVNKSVPYDPAVLARMLGFTKEEIEAALPGVIPFLAEANGNLLIPELEGYREHLLGVREKQSMGGKRGADKTNNKRKLSESGNPSGYPQDTCRGTDGSLVKSSTGKSSSLKPLAMVEIPTPSIGRNG